MFKISVIVPVYNVEKYLQRCVQSITNQSYSNLEIILVDDGSTDNSAFLCDALAEKDSRIFVIHKTNGGLSSARNAGMDRATGEYITFVDSDDYLDVNIYERMMEVLEGKGKTVLANMSFCRVNDDGICAPSSVVYKQDCIISPEEYLKSLLLHQGDVSVCTKLFPMELVKNIRFVEGKSNEDLLFILNVIFQLDNIYFLEKIGYYYYCRNGSISNGYGKAVCDMVENSVVAYEYTLNNYPTLKKIAFRFLMYQHMAYLLLVPKEEACTDLYKQALSIIRKKLFSALFNKYLKGKQKLILLGIAFFPKAMAKSYQRRRKK